MRLPLSSCALASLLAVAVSACAPSDDAGAGGEGDRSPASSFGYELAAGQTAVQTADPQAPGEEPAAPAGTVIDLMPAELSEKLAAGDIRLIDVRTAEEVAEGIIPGAEHIALDEFDPALLDGDDDREIVLYCRSGRRSGIAGQALADHTGEAAQHLSGGILAWQEAGLETAQPAAPPAP